jgi:RHS repeat-associated protein
VRNHYYSFGMLQDNTWQGIAPGGRAQLRYKYNGKELHKGSRLLDYGFRYYDPSVGRFTGVDPIADKFPHVTTYNYAENEPIAHIDLWGLQKYFAASGEFIVQNGSDKSLRVVTSGTLNDCQRMSCSELASNSVSVQVSTKENKNSVLSAWAKKYQGLSNRYSNESEGNREYAMSIYSGVINSANGSQEVFVEGSTIMGTKGVDGVSLVDSKSPIKGWSESEAIHTHRWGDNSGDFSDGSIGPFLSDIPTAIKSGNPLYLVVPNSNYIGVFDPTKYNNNIKNGDTHDRAKRRAINSQAIKIE